MRVNLPASTTELLRKTAWHALGCLLRCLDGEATNGARPPTAPRRQGSAASKQDTSSNTIDTELAAMAVVVCILNAGGRVGEHCRCGQPNSVAADAN